jgi:small subunit ribosomal protein S3
MSAVKRIMEDSLKRLEIEEFLAEVYKRAGYGSIKLTKTPYGTQINLYAMNPGRVIGKRGRTIKEVTARLENELGIPNPQITVVEVEVPELNPQIMASRIADALERGIHYRRAVFWALRRIMDSGAIGCEIIVKGKLRSRRSRFEKVSEGYLPKSGNPSTEYLKSAIAHVKTKRGITGVTVSIVPPDAEFPDKIDIEDLKKAETQEEDHQLSEELQADAADHVESMVETIEA